MYSYISLSLCIYIYIYDFIVCSRQASAYFYALGPALWVVAMANGDYVSVDYDISMLC